MNSLLRTAFAILAASLVFGCSPNGSGTEFPAIATYATSPGLADALLVPRNGVFELSLVQQADYGPQGNFLDVDIAVTFRHAWSGTEVAVHGFYYAEVAQGENMWKVRFAPSLEGLWEYDYTFTNTPSSQSRAGTGSFTCQASELPGFLRSNAANPFQLEDGQGTPVYPIGLNECLQLDERMPFDGGDRYGAFRGDGSVDQYLATYARAGFNMFRFSQANCSPELVDAEFLQYDADTGMYFDWLCERLRSHGYHVYYSLFGFLVPDFPEDPPTAELVRFVQYSVDRWGAYAGIWELLNERDASAAWIDAVAQVVRDRDPYGHPVTTSWEHPELASIELNAPHWYADELALDSDKVTADLADQWRAFGKPVLVGEQGNSQPPNQDFGNWSPESALRMRLRTWTAFFHQVSFLFWNTSWATNGAAGGASNIYLGPDERRVAHLLRWFESFVLRPGSYVLDPAPIDGLDPGTVRAHALASPDTLAIYFHHASDHSTPVSGEGVTISAPAAGTGWFIDPATGQLLDTLAIAPGPNALILPDFVVDLAFFTAPDLGPTDPITIVDILNQQADGDLDEDGLPDWGPAGPPFGVPPLTLNFDASGSYDLDGGTVLFEWDFGDGQASTDAVTVHTYAKGNHLTTLTVTDDEGRTARHSFFVRAVADASPNLNASPVLSPLVDRAVAEGEALFLTPFASDQELTGGSYGGGHTSGPGLEFTVEGLPPGAAFGPWDPSSEVPRLLWLPTFDQAGTWTLEFQAHDDSGASSAKGEVTIEVNDAPEPE